jgi:FkbM family methyltransferase
VILDCGGNIGLSVLRFKQRYPRSRIIVFEPDPVISEVLRSNLRSQALEDVRVFQAAAWTEAGQVGWHRDGADSSRIDPAYRQSMIESVRLADFITERVDLLKVDIEGAEYNVLLDLCQTGKIGYVQRLICELHGRANDNRSLGLVLKSLTDRGFCLTLPFAHSAPGLLGDREPTPFPSARDGKFVLHLYAWQNLTLCA